MLKLIYKSNFNISRAELDEWWELWKTRKNWRGREVIKPINMYYGEMTTIPYRGDLKWAKRIAKHYGIEVPTPTKNKDK